MKGEISKKHTPNKYITMNILHKSLLFASAVGAISFASCDSADPNAEIANFDNSRFDAADLTNLTAPAVMPRIIVPGDKFTFTAAGNTTSHDEDYAPTANRHGAEWIVDGLNQLDIRRYADPALRTRFPDVEATWGLGANPQQGVVTTSDTLDQTEIDQFTATAAANSTSGGVFTNPFTDSNGDLDGNISTALAQAGLVDVNVPEPKGNDIEREFKTLSKEIYNNADGYPHMHGPVMYYDPGVRGTVRRVFTFNATSTNAELVNNNQITGSYTITEIYSHLYTHSELAGSEGFIRLLMGGPLSGNTQIESGTFVLDLNN